MINPVSTQWTFLVDLCVSKVSDNDKIMYSTFTPVILLIAFSPLLIKVSWPVYLSTDLKKPLWWQLVLYLIFSMGISHLYISFWFLFKQIWIYSYLLFDTRVFCLYTYLWRPWLFPLEYVCVSKTHIYIEIPTQTWIIILSFNTTDMQFILKSINAFLPR